MKAQAYHYLYLSLIADREKLKVALYLPHELHFNLDSPLLYKPLTKNIQE